MHRFLMPAAIAALGLTVITPAHATDQDAWFVNLGAGRADYHANFDHQVSGSDHGTGEILNVGWRRAFVGLEAGYTNLGNVSYTDGTYTLKLNGRGYTAGFDVHADVTSHFYVSGRFGAFFWKETAKLWTGSNTPARGHLSSTDWYGGVGAGADINRHWSVGAAFDFYRTSHNGFDVGTRMYTVDVEYRF